MSILTAVYSHLAADAGVIAITSTRIYPSTAPTSASLPYITYHQIRCDHPHHLTSAAGLADEGIQIDCWDDGALGAEALAAAVREGMDGFCGAMGTLAAKGVHLHDEGMDFFDKLQSGREGGTYRKRMDFRIWHAESVPTF